MPFGFISKTDPVDEQLSLCSARWETPQAHFHVTRHFVFTECMLLNTGILCEKMECALLFCFILFQHFYLKYI